MIIAGEASGDLHGSGVVRELKLRDPGCAVYGIGGDMMRACGMELIYHIRELSVMGFLEVIGHLPVLKSVEKTLAVLLKVRRPDLLLLIDYPGFNLHFARAARKEGIRIFYYISPQVWAWNRGRVRKMKNLIDKMFVTFPFEVEIYRNEGIDVEFVGHPLLEVLEEPQGRKEFCKRYGYDEGRQILGLFPGSRRQEIERIFPQMLGAARLLHGRTGLQTAVSAASVLDYDFIDSFIRDDFPVRLIRNATHDIMKNADVALVTSGTATLETAYYQTPMVVAYRTSWLSYFIGRLLLKIRNIGLVNIVAGRKIVPELIQHQVTPGRLAQEALAMLEDGEFRMKITDQLAVIKTKLGTKGASARVANAILSS